MPLETMPHLAKELFGDLIRLASGVMSEAELNNHHHSPLELGENIAVGYQPVINPTKTGSQSEHGVAEVGGDQIISKACDIVDEIIDDELKQLYARASEFKPGTAESTAVRRKISATETFHSKILDAFKEYTHSTLIGEAKQIPAEGQKLAAELSK